MSFEKHYPRWHYHWPEPVTRENWPDNDNHKISDAIMLLSCWCQDRDQNRIFPWLNTPALVQITGWRRPGDKPLSEPMMVNLLTHICISLPKRVKEYFISTWHIYFWDNFFCYKIFEISTMRVYAISVWYIYTFINQNYSDNHIMQSLVFCQRMNYFMKKLKYCV